MLNGPAARPTHPGRIGLRRPSTARRQAVLTRHRRVDAADRTKNPEARSPDQSGSAAARRLVGNTDHGDYHHSTCGSIEIDGRRHRIDLASYDEAIAQGYQPCNTCSPHSVQSSTSLSRRTARSRPCSETSTATRVPPPRDGLAAG